MKTLRNFVANKYKNKVNESTYNALLKIADFVESNYDSGSLEWDAKDGLNNWILKKGALVNADDPTINDWKIFLDDDAISNILLDISIKRQKPILRKVLSNLSNDGNIKQSDIKAIEALERLLNKSDNEESNVMYVQYYSAVAYDDEIDNESLVNNYLVKG